MIYKIKMALLRALETLKIKARMALCLAMRSFARTPAVAPYSPPQRETIEDINTNCLDDSPLVGAYKHEDLVPLVYPTMSEEQSEFYAKEMSRLAASIHAERLGYRSIKNNPQPKFSIE